ncbi:uncharacterized protein LOC143200490 [Rhynchophorus ferrugineus]|uniref:uncharacterized protein LOC143200490 n=1 Tax=Rhynchophorus ferrugineus TaxID=354439 RepID=UPI003FCE70DE
MSISSYVIILLLLFVNNIENNINIKRLAPIQVQYDAPNQKVTTRNHNEFSIVGKLVQLNSNHDSKSFNDNYDNLDDVSYIDDGRSKILARGKKNTKEWDHWGKWSSCSVTCGVGKMTRWRHCLSKGCASGEKEAQIRSCSMKPCP